MQADPSVANDSPRILGLPTVCQATFKLENDFLEWGIPPPNPQGIYRFLADLIGTGAAVTAPASPRLQQRSGRIPAEPYPPCKRL
jgi:hypothetical protein